MACRSNPLVTSHVLVTVNTCVAIAKCCTCAWASATRPAPGGHWMHRCTQCPPNGYEHDHDHPNQSQTVDQAHTATASSYSYSKECSPYFPCFLFVLSPSCHHHYRSLSLLLFSLQQISCRTCHAALALPPVKVCQGVWNPTPR